MHIQALTVHAHSHVGCVDILDGKFTDGKEKMAPSRTAIRSEGRGCDATSGSPGSHKTRLPSQQRRRGLRRDSGHRVRGKATSDRSQFPKGAAKGSVVMVTEVVPTAA